MNKIHPIQISILRVLLFQPQAKFSQLNTQKISSDNFTFHLKSLVKSGLVRKTGELYVLTKEGKEFANRFDTGLKKPVIEKQAKLGVLVCPIKKEKGVIKYLVQQRLKQPFYGYHGFLTGKIRWAETVLQAASRELLEETGLSAKLKLVAVRHKMDYSPAGDFLEDKYFFVCRAIQPRGRLIDSFEGGRNFWLTKPEILALPNLFQDVKLTIALASQTSFRFVEKKYFEKGY